MAPIESVISAPFVGRERELADLHAAWAAAGSGHGSLWLFSGEAGIGKTRLVDEFVHRTGARAAWGRCWEAGGAPAYWPWVEALRSFAVSGVESSVPAAVGSLLDPHRETLERGNADDHLAARFELFESVAGYLRDRTREAPAIIVLDDLHAADESSLLLLQFVARQLRTVGALILGTYRPEAARARPEIDVLLASCAREGRPTPLALLDREDVAALLRAMDLVTGDEIVDNILAATGGNALFVAEIARHLAAHRGAVSIPALDLPEGIRQAIRLRLQSVSESARQLLAAAAVSGIEFDPDTVGELGGLSHEETKRALSEAMGAELLVAGQSRAYRFAHGLLRQVLYDDLGPQARPVLHAAFASILEMRVAGSPPEVAAELAHHLTAAGPLADAAKTRAYRIKAARRAMHQLAYERAVEHLSAALVTFPEDDRSHEHAALLIELAEAEAAAGRLPRAVEALERAIVFVEHATGAEELFGQAVYLYADLRGRTSLDAAPWLQLIERAIDKLRGRDVGIRVSLIAQYVMTLVDGPRIVADVPVDVMGRAQALIAEAAAVAERLDDPSLRAICCAAHFSALPEHDDRRIDVLRDLLAASHQTNDPVTLFRALGFETVISLERGDIVKAKVAVTRSIAAAEESRRPMVLAQAAERRAMIALLEGRFADMEEHLEVALSYGMFVTPNRAIGLRFQSYLDQDRLAELEDDIRRFVERRPQLSVRVELALLLALTGRRDEARRMFPDLLSDPLIDMASERPHSWTYTVGMLAVLTAELDDVLAATRLHALLAPLFGRVVGYTNLVWWAPVAYFLGRLDATRFRTDDAIAQFDSAIALAARIGARPALANAQFYCAGALRERNQPGDIARSESLLAEASRAAVELGMVRLERLIAHDETHPSEQASPYRFERNGDYWEVVFDGELVRLRHTKGMQHLARLLSEPGREFHAIDLAGSPPVRGSGGTTIRARDVAGGAGVFLDAQAKSAYKRRLEDLRAEVEDADRFEDVERAARARAEIDFLTTELARAVGLGGRDRKAVDDAERARQTVTKALKASIERIAGAHEVLGRHLAETVRTGIYCSYRPDPRVPITWRVELS